MIFSKWLTLTSLILSLSSVGLAAEDSINVSFIYDSSGLPIGSTAGSINALITNATLAVTQSTSPWITNITQFGGTNVSTGTGAGGAGIPRVTVSSDSSITNISGTVSLPTLASTSTKQSDGSQKTQIVDGSGNVIGSNGNYLEVYSKMPLTVNAPFTVSVGVTSTTFLASNASRKGMCTVNTSNATVSYAVGTAAVLNSGITLYPGGTWCMDEYSFATGQINAIASAAASGVSGQEFQ